MPTAIGATRNIKAATGNCKRDAERKKQNQVLRPVVAPKPPVSFYEMAYYWLMSRH